MRWLERTSQVIWQLSPSARANQSNAHYNNRKLMTSFTESPPETLIERSYSQFTVLYRNSPSRSTQALCLFHALPEKILQHFFLLFVSKRTPLKASYLLQKLLNAFRFKIIWHTSSVITQIYQSTKAAAFHSNAVQFKKSLLIITFLYRITKILYEYIYVWRKFGSHKL